MRESSLAAGSRFLAGLVIWVCFAAAFFVFMVLFRPDASSD
jgi:hypothetical protein